MRDRILLSSEEREYIWVNDDIKIVDGQDGHPVEVIGAWSDITNLGTKVVIVRKSCTKYRTSALSSKANTPHLKPA